MKKNDIWSKINDDLLIIAEIGKNFIDTEEEQTVKQYLEKAKKLALAAKNSGADAVKFQTHQIEDEQLNIDVTSPHFKGSDRYSWVKRNTNITPFEEFWKPLKQYCDEIGIIFFSTPMSRNAAKILKKTDIQLWKVGSGDILDFVMLDYLASTDIPIIISSGMSTLQETDKAVNFLKERGARFALLHCVSQYPCPPEKLNLSTISFFQKRYKIPIGFSDHSVGNHTWETAVAALDQGAKIIEKHFSFSRELWGSDHKASITPPELKNLVKKIDLYEKDNSTIDKIDKNFLNKAMGRKEKTLQEEESVFRPFFRKSLVAGEDIKKGEIVTAEKIYAMRPQMYCKGLPSEEYESVVNKKTTKNIKKYDPITLDTFV